MASTESSNPFIAGNPESRLHENMPIADYVKEPGMLRGSSGWTQCPDCIGAAALSLAHAQVIVEIRTNARLFARSCIGTAFAVRGHDEVGTSKWQRLS